MLCLAASTRGRGSARAQKGKYHGVKKNTTIRKGRDEIMSGIGVFVQQRASSGLAPGTVTYTRYQITYNVSVKKPL